MKKLDDDIANIQNTRNYLETLIYEVRDKLEDQYIPVVRPKIINDHKETITNLMYKLEDEEDISNNVNTYTKDIDIIKSITIPLETLLKEHMERPRAEAGLIHQIKEYITTAQTADYMDDEKKRKVMDKCRTVQEWLQLKMREQQEQPLWKEVVVTASLLKQKLNEVHAICRPLVKKPTPPPPPVVEKNVEGDEGEKMDTDESVDASARPDSGDMEADPEVTKNQTP